MRKRTEKPRACRSAPSAADANPLPREETTPPVIKMYRVMDPQTIWNAQRFEADKYAADRFFKTVAKKSRFSGALLGAWNKWTLRCWLLSPQWGWRRCHRSRITIGIGHQWYGLIDWHRVQDRRIATFLLVEKRQTDACQKEETCQNRRCAGQQVACAPVGDRKSTRLNSRHSQQSRMPSSA